MTDLSPGSDLFDTDSVDSDDRNVAAVVARFNEDFNNGFGGPTIPPIIMDGYLRGVDWLLRKIDGK